LTGSGTANLSLAGQGSVTLGSLTGSGAGTLAITGTGSVTLGTLTGSGTGSLSISGVGSVTLGALTGSGAGTLTISGAASVTLGALTGTATGSLQIKGQGSVTLGALTGSGTGTGPCPTAQEIAQEVWNYILEGSVSAGQMLRGIARTQLAKVAINETTGEVTIYKLDGTTIFAQALTSPTGDRNAPTVDWT
jgi:hypothetical protein